MKPVRGGGRFAAFGRELRRRRLAVELSLRDLAVRAQLSHVHIRQVEHGLVNPPADAAIIRLAEAVEADPRRLLGLAGRVSPMIHAAFRRDPGTLETAASVILAKRGRTGADTDSQTVAP